ncbi:hypothetical protein Dshi_2763 [Dinoroseobacter shibae DFL 12 = DSM 16493]|jgi:hypothetical protein|uniref:Hemolysin-type calcium-binding region n=1 Tax=Dinoroseobacter shibae (strain DSM 16493 / NCIMB 14021 / DFL 12) TaxID=398580 RepID=A8LJ01_DINSH|nr:hypothetical protein [Dinoroseobacter shibae]ABV94496.1 hypothetical protein Dshi_2763 [Dinoroseobacter shibae DFL 12 = DSM 16493]URF45923.1 hypothetical protein M8008_14240 [Dinoroseobacter shibae]URF50229.1 hypothetical protein M8007_14240 [Dinoroseobacter shibae]
MSFFQNYIDNAALIEGDLATIQDVTGDVADALEAVDAFLGIPAQISSALDAANDALSIPTTVINALKALPFGIGSAVSAFQTASTGLKTTITTTRQTMDRIDDRLEPVRDAVEDGSEAVSVAVTTVSLAATAFIVVEDEAARLEASLGDQQFIGGDVFRLPTQLEDFNTAVDEYEALRNEVLGTISAVAALAENAANAIADAIPDLSLATGLKAALETVFDPITDLLNDVEDALDFNIGIGFVSFNVLDVLKSIGDFAGFIVDAVEAAANAVLGVIGLSLGSIDDAINGLISDLLAPFNPIQQAIEDLNAQFDSLLAELTAPLNEAVGDLIDLTRELRDAVDVGILFDNSIVGDEAPDLVRFADELRGVDGQSDAIYGLLGRDTLIGGEDDFVFGGRGGDTIIAEGGRIEAYGGVGRDRITVSDEVPGGSFVADGGAGNDIMIGGDLADVFFGNTGNDIMVGNGGVDAFYFAGEVGNDRIFGRDAILDDLFYVDFALVGGDALTETEFLEDYAEVSRNRTTVTFDDEAGSVTFFGVRDAAALFDQFIFTDTALA